MIQPGNCLPVKSVAVRNASQGLTGADTMLNVAIFSNCHHLTFLLRISLTDVS
jgi:hypothetical protein